MAGTLRQTGRVPWTILGTQRHLLRKAPAARSKLQNPSASQCNAVLPRCLCRVVVVVVIMRGRVVVLRRGLERELQCCVSRYVVICVHVSHSYQPNRGCRWARRLGVGSMVP